MGDRPWHKRYHSDALTGYANLDLEERGAYTTILDLIYDRGGPLNMTDRLLAGYLGVSMRKSRSLIDSLIAHGKLWRTPEGHLFNKRARDELEKSSKGRRKRAENDLKMGSNAQCNSPETEKKPNEINDGNLVECDESGRHIRYQIPDSSVSSKDDTAPPPSKHDPKPISETDQWLRKKAVELYNATASKAGLPLVVWPISERRRKSLDARLRQAKGIIGWQMALAKVAGSQFLCGENDRGWRADFDFVLQEKSFTRIMEGGYDRSINRKVADGGRGFSLLDSAVEIAGGYPQGDDEEV